MLDALAHGSHLHIVKYTDRHWESCGKLEPYFGVLTDPKFKRKTLDSKTLSEFFETGEQDVKKLFDDIQRHFPTDLSFTKVLDFGCGVGRLTLPFAKRCKMVHGMDVSTSMLQEARLNAANSGLLNVAFFESDDSLSKAETDYDLIHSYLVLQHIPTERGVRIIQQLLKRLAPRGIFALEFPYYTDRSRVRGAVSKLRRYLPLANYAANLVEGNPLTFPHMEMNVYPLDELCRMIQERGVEEMFIQFSRQPLYFSARLIGRGS